MTKTIIKRQSSEADGNETSSKNRDGNRKRIRSRASKVKFGGVTVSGSKPSDEVVRVNIDRSTDALVRVTRKLIKPGVTFRMKKDVPRFSVDEEHPGVFIRRLNGRTERGRMVNGVFEVID